MSGKFRLLVAEDREDDCILLRQAIAKSGLDIAATFVHDGQEVINYLTVCARHQQVLPALVLLDLGLPEVSAIEVLQWIRARPELAGLIVIIWSGSLDPGKRRASLEHGANMFIPKPADWSRLDAMVKTLYRFARDRDSMEDGFGI